MKRQLTGIDIYSGAGGMSIGAEMGAPGLSIRYGLDYDRHACSTFAHNHPEAHVDCADVSTITAKHILESAGIDEIDYLLTGPSCQAVSTMGLFYTADSRNLLFTHLARLLSELKALGKLPRNVVLENVPGIVYQKNVVLVRDLLRFFSQFGYRVGADVVCVAALGVPQLRYRFFLRATLEDQPIKFPAARFGDITVTTRLAPYRSVSEAISDLYDVPPSNTDDGVPYHPGVPTEYQRELRGRCKRVANHWVSNTDQINLDRIADIPQGGSWKDIAPERLPARFHRVRMTDYHTLYGRLHEHNPSYTISAQFGNVTAGCYTHPLRKRALTVREGARIQGFPDRYRFLGPKNSQYRQVGNAVPPYAMRELMRFWVSRAFDGLEARDPRITLEILDTGKKLPVMASRFKGRKSEQANGRSGYGSGTFWPKGWGASPAELPGHVENYRKVDDPLVFRRTAWRLRRETEDQDAHFAKVAAVDVSAVRDRLGTRNAWALESIATLAAPAQRTDKGSADDFFDILVAATALVLAMDGSLVVVTDFAYTADRFSLFLHRYCQKQRLPVEVTRLGAQALSAPTLPFGTTREVAVLTYADISDTRALGSLERIAAGRKRVHFSPFVRADERHRRGAVRWSGLVVSPVSVKESSALLTEAAGTAEGQKVPLLATGR
jgi:DNA-cytosine methyltransferase